MQTHVLSKPYDFIYFILISNSSECFNFFSNNHISRLTLGIKNQYKYIRIRLSQSEVSCEIRFLPLPARFQYTEKLDNSDTKYQYLDSDFNIQMSSLIDTHSNIQSCIKDFTDAFYFVQALALFITFLVVFYCKICSFTKSIWSLRWSLVFLGKNKISYLETIDNTVCSRKICLRNSKNLRVYMHIQYSIFIKIRRFAFPSDALYN